MRRRSTDRAAASPEARGGGKAGAAWRALLGAGACAGLLALAGPSVTACTDSSGPGHVCDRITTRDGGFNISTLCGLGTTGGTSNHVADEQDRVISFDFDISCTDGSERIMGRVFDVVYNDAGQIVSFEATINGTSCTYPR